ncbi:MAG: nucleotidyltransferase [Candidatus Fischerbacteria bacterium RBG_13_37_8]|uniref:Nucleotidyltransferase n=1 Tax=Candidatus Fischerbacteria bacterium RBG_13_37_8 TaxID=1817863 RepID=A0A1F5VJH8_9BACT|nr:MAG: nucleotidyltransferase [Candidatus Fischerbacteria bacterium RBG_13_37_8]
MKWDDLENKNILFFKCIIGSKAYGLDTAASDIDIKGVFVLPREQYYGLDYINQMSNESNDMVFYELKRFFELLYVNNPGILELIAMPEDCVLYKHKLFDLIKPELFLSMQCQKTFAGYAFDQIKRAKGLKKKIMNPVPAKKMNVLDFCYIIENQGSIPLKPWLRKNKLKQEYCGLACISHVKDIYGLYYDHDAASSKNKTISRFKGIIKKEITDDVSLSSIPKDLAPVAYMCFNKDAYSQYCRQYKEYWSWVKKRNEVRYQDTIAHGKNYDAKNMMHTFRLLHMAEEIARFGKIITRRPDRNKLLSIKQGKFLYDDLVSMAEEKLLEIKELYQKSALPLKPDREKINSLLVEIRTHFYKHKASYS